MPKNPTKKEPTNVVPDPNLEESIRQRAYALYEEGGREDGHDIDDWLRAEAEISAKTEAEISAAAQKAA